MNRTLVNWLLGGALAASLTWNWRQIAARSPDETVSAAPTCAAMSCSLLGLDATQSAALDALCERSCGRSDRLERQAAELQRELLASLAREEVDEPAAQQLVVAVSELRRQALASCVEGILEVRKVLTPEQVHRLLDQCAAQCDRGAAQPTEPGR